MIEGKLNRIGFLYANNIFAGTIEEFRDQYREYYRFTYDQEYSKFYPPIGYAFPTNQITFEYDHLPPFFQNLTSEGWIRTFQSKKADLSKEDSFGLLLANGSELIGALSIKTERVLT